MFNAISSWIQSLNGFIQFCLAIVILSVFFWLCDVLGRIGKIILLVLDKAIKRLEGE